MNDLTQIVNLLSDDQIPLSSSLYKLKTFAHRINNSQLSLWIDKELKGYELNENIPSYRQFECILYCNISIIDFKQAWAQKRFQIDFNAFPLNLKKTIKAITLYQSISSLENLDKNQPLRFSVPQSLIPIINDYYQKMGNNGFSTHSVWAEISITAIDELLAHLRTLFLNIMLELENQLGFKISLSEILSNKKETVNNIIQHIMNQNNFSSSGDGNFFNTGNNNQITQNVHIEKNNLKQLRKNLEDNGIEDIDIIELENIIDTETPNQETRKFGDKVNSWITKMMAKALDGSW